MTRAAKSPNTSSGTVAPDRAEALGGSFSAAVQGMFNHLAPRYDAFNRWASLGLDSSWRRAAIRTLGASPGSWVLDIATGTGDLAVALARRGCRVAGADFAADMLVLARRKAPGTGRVRPSFQVARAEQLPYASGSFHAAVSAFAMRNVRPFLDDVLAEAFRVLRPGGRLVILEFSRPRRSAVRWAHETYTRRLMPRIGRWLTGDPEPFEYLSRSIQAWNSPERFAERLEAAGFVRVGYRPLSLGTVALHWGERPGNRSGR